MGDWTPPGYTTLVLAHDEFDAAEAATRYGIGSYVYPRTLSDLDGVLPWAVMRVDGWRESHDLRTTVLHGVDNLVRAFDAEDREVPASAEHYLGRRRARVAMRELAQWRRVTRRAFIDPDATTSVYPRPTWWQRIAHTMGLCPRERAGWPCSGAPGRCAWAVG